MFTLADLATRRVVSTGHTRIEMEALKADSGGSLVHYTTSDIEGTPKPDLTVIVKGFAKLFKAEYIPFDEIREIRTKILRETDYRDLPSYPGTDQAAWRTYRQQLRDIPQDYDKVKDVVWPTKPS